MTSPSNDTAKRGPSNWIPHTWTSPAIKAASTARRTLIPAFAAAILMSSALLACGSDASERTSSTSDSEQSAVVSTAQQDQDDNQSSSRDAAQDQNGQQPGDNSKAPSGGNSDQPKATAKPKATALPTPEPSPTYTPEPTPTPTMAPPPTRHPLDVMSDLTDGYWESDAHTALSDLTNHNNALILEALISALIDFITEEYPIWAKSFERAELEHSVNQSIRDIRWERIPSNDGQLLIEIIFHFEAADDIALYTHKASVNGVFELVSPPFENLGIPRTTELEAFTDQAPVFSHLVSELVVGPAKKH